MITDHDMESGSDWKQGIVRKEIIYKHQHVNILQGRPGTIINPAERTFNM